MTTVDSADIVNIRFHCSQEFLRILYQASDAVLANSGHEPFGLVGLETMAAGGIAVTGGTGEDYAVPFYNAIVLETSDPAEIEAYICYLDANPSEKEKIRRAARQTAELYTWENVIKNLVQKLEYQAAIQGLITRERGLAVKTARISDVNSSPQSHKLLPQIKLLGGGQTHRTPAVPSTIN